MKENLYSSRLPRKGNDFKELSLNHNLSAGQVWYLVQCKPNGEQMALRNLKNQDFPVFLPLQELTYRKGNAFQTQVRPLFPGYMFVGQDPAAGQWRKINNTRGVARLVSITSSPTPVPSAIMKQLFEQCDTTDIFQQGVKLVTGDNVKITQGPFIGAMGKIMEIEPSQRVHLLLDIMGQKSRLTIDGDGLTPVN
jgi:transcriptional antiterminator RfaH